MKKAIINKEVEHQGIGGKEIEIEKEMSLGKILDTNFNEMPIAMANFIFRRTDLFNKNDDMKVYYGHVGLLGYFVAEDEITFI